MQWYSNDGIQKQNGIISTIGSSFLKYIDPFLSSIRKLIIYDICVVVQQREITYSLKHKSISVLGWCTGVTAKLPQLREGPEEDRLPEGVGVASSSSSSVVRPGESS